MSKNIQKGLVILLMALICGAGFAKGATTTKLPPAAHQQLHQ